MYNQTLQEILTKIEERSDEIRCFCPNCGQMTQMTKHEDEYDMIYYKCYNCPYEFDRFEHLEQYNIMRFSA